MREENTIQSCVKMYYIFFRRPEVVSFNLETNQYHSRPNSAIFTIAEEIEPIGNLSSQPDLIQSVSTYNLDENKEEQFLTLKLGNEIEGNNDEEIVDNSKFNFLRKKSVMIRKSIARKLSKDSDDSVIVHDVQFRQMPFDENHYQEIS